MKLSIEFDYITGHIVLQTPRGFKTFEADTGPLCAELRHWDRQSRIIEDQALERTVTDGTCSGCGKAGNVVPFGGRPWHLSCWHNAKLPAPKPVTKVPEGRRTLITAHRDGTVVRKITPKPGKPGMLTLEDLGEL